MTDTKAIIQHSINNSYKKYIPIMTAICCLISVILYIGVHLEGNLNSWEVYKKWGSPSVIDIFNGSYWGLITSNFLHVQLWHIGFNIYWLWIFGKKIEFESKKPFFVFLIVSSALVSSLSELSFTDTTGIGLSGIVYALFGYIFVQSKTVEAYKTYRDIKIVRLFIFWLFLCIVLTQTKVWNVGNAAHIGGLIWGMTLAYLSKFATYKQWLIELGLILILASSIFWNPFSISWLTYQAYELHKNQHADEAIPIYKKIISRDPNNMFAKANLKQLEIHQLQEKAHELHANRKYNEARKVYNQILLIDPEEPWAKDNLKLLPNE